MPLQILPLNLPGETMTELMKEAVAEMLAELEPLSREVYSDGVLPGTFHLSAPERLANYLNNTDPSDMELLIDDDYLLRLKNGLDRPPVSPFWLNQISTQGTYERNRRDFVRLINQETAKHIKGLE